MEETFTYDESYGHLRSDTHALIKRHNVSPADYTMIVFGLGGQDWDRINGFIRQNVRGMLRNFHYPFGG